MRRRMLRDRLTRSAFELGPGRKPDGEAPSGLTVWSRDISQFAGRPWHRPGRVDWAVKADGVVVGLTTEAVEGLPTAVEDQVEVVVRPSLRVSPSVDVGAHYDDGDADTGSGLEVGGGLAVEHLPTRLSLSAEGRYLVTHHAEAFEEWGAGVPSINSSCMRLANFLQPGCFGRLHVGRFKSRRRLYSGVEV